MTQIQEIVAKKRLFEPPYPYINQEIYNLPLYINSHYYSIDSLYTKIGSFSKKYLYLHTINNQVLISCTDNNIRHKMNNNSKLYGDIGIIKIKHHLGLDISRDTIIYQLIKQNILPILNLNPDDFMKIGLSMISPDNSITRYSRQTKQKYMDTYGKNNIKLLIWDTETTGINKDDRIVELAIFDVTNNKTYNQRFKPEQIEMSSIASQITGIETDHLINEPLFKDKMKEIEEFIIGDGSQIPVMVAHNSKFDERMLYREYTINNIELPKGIVFVDSMELFKTWLSGNDYHINEITRIAEKGTFKLSTTETDNESYRGKDLYYRYFNKYMDSSHNALADVMGLWDLLKIFYLKIWGRNEEWFMIKKMLELTFISEILDTPYITDLMNR